MSLPPPPTLRPPTALAPATTNSGNVPSPSLPPTSQPFAETEGSTPDDFPEPEEPGIPPVDDLPLISCERGKRSKIIVPTEVMLAILPIPLNKNNETLNALVSEGLIAKPRIMASNKTDKQILLHFSQKPITKKSLAKAKPEDPKPIPMQPKTEAWLAYTTLNISRKLIDKTPGYATVYYDHEASKKKTISLYCSIAKIPEVVEVSEGVFEEKPIPLEELNTLEESAASKMKKQLQGVWFAKGVLSEKSIEDIYIVFAEDKLCPEIYFDNEKAARCHSTYNRYVLASPDTLHFDDDFGYRNTWKFILRGQTLSVTTEGGLFSGSKRVYGKTNIPITEQILQDSHITAPKISHMQVTDITSHSAKITWTTDVPADSGLDYKAVGARGGVGGSTNDLVQDHIVPLDSLIPNTTYHFTVYSKNVGGTAKMPESSFTTLSSSQSQITVSNFREVACDGKEYSFTIPQKTKLAFVPATKDTMDKLLSKKLVIEASELLTNPEDEFKNLNYSYTTYFVDYAQPRLDNPVFPNRSMWLVLIKETAIPKISQGGYLGSIYPLSKENMAYIRRQVWGSNALRGLEITTIPAANFEGTQIQLSCELTKG